MRIHKVIETTYTLGDSFKHISTSTIPNFIKALEDAGVDLTDLELDITEDKNGYKFINLGKTVRRYFDETTLGYMERNAK